MCLEVSSVVSFSKSAGASTEKLAVPSTIFSAVKVSDVADPTFLLSSQTSLMASPSFQLTKPVPRSIEVLVAPSSGTASNVISLRSKSYEGALSSGAFISFFVQDTGIIRTEARAIIIKFFFIIPFILPVKHFIIYIIAFRRCIDTCAC